MGASSLVAPFLPSGQHLVFPPEPSPVFLRDLPLCHLLSNSLVLQAMQAFLKLSALSSQLSFLLRRWLRLLLLKLFFILFLLTLLLLFPSALLKLLLLHPPSKLLHLFLDWILFKSDMPSFPTLPPFSPNSLSSLALGCFDFLLQERLALEAIQANAPIAVLYSLNPIPILEKVWFKRKYPIKFN